jgi:phage FluMu protein Com
MDVPCPKCKLTGQVPAPAMTKAEKAHRTRENAYRRRAKLDPLPPPPKTVDCPRCYGKGTIRASTEVRGA